MYVAMGLSESSKLQDAAAVAPRRTGGSYEKDSETDGKVLRPDWRVSFTENNVWYDPMVKFFHSKAPSLVPALTADTMKKKTDAILLTRLEVIFKNIAAEYRKGHATRAVDELQESDGDDDPKTEEGENRSNRHRTRKTRKSEERMETIEEENLELPDELSFFLQPRYQSTDESDTAEYGGGPGPVDVASKKKGKSGRPEKLPKATRNDVDRLRGTKDSSGTPAGNVDNVPEKRKRKRSEGASSRSKKAKIGKKAGLTARGASGTASGRSSNVGTEDDDAMARYGGFVDDDDGEKVQTVVAAGGKNRGLPSTSSVAVSRPIVVKFVSKKEQRGGKNKWQESDLPSAARDRFKIVLLLMKELHGTSENFWHNPTVAQVQSVVSRVFGDGKYLVVKDGVWYDLISYRLSNYRRKLAVWALTTMQYIIRDAHKRKTKKEEKARKTNASRKAGSAADKGIADAGANADANDADSDSDDGGYDFTNPSHVAEWVELMQKDGHKTGFMSFLIHYTFAFHLTELDDIPAEYERSDARPYGAVMIVAQAVECILKYWGSGEYQAPSSAASDTNVSRDHWDDKYEKDRALTGWSDDRWMEFIEAASDWKEPKRRKRGTASSVASSEAEDVGLPEEDADGDGIVVSD
ncbi:hypothetical protein MVEN_02317700 [Mycena venus]|uniref:Uncharacterized protein n=1 Tax=Mycena venus TaxID=2733690 RepID=A0A8H7CE02_9AGAR|nr:hypothetical protein MVEN_02317700 [Mycena venus]